LIFLVLSTISLAKILPGSAEYMDELSPVFNAIVDAG